VNPVAQTFLAAAALAVVHLVAGGLRFLDTTPRSIWLSASGGVSVAYVFVHVLPELAEAQTTFGENLVLRAAERHAYLLALAGLALFYGLERLVREDQRTRTPSHSEESTTSAGTFWLHIGSFAAYNLLFGYLLLERDVVGTRELLFYSVAIGLHFVVNNYGLRKDHRAAYDRVGRWILAAALLAGWALGLSFEIHEPGTAVLFALLAGGIVLNVLKEELPEQRQSRFWAFAAGAAGYACLLLAAA
jgi:hypothetical protein